MESVNPEDVKIRVNVDKAWTALRGRLENEGLIPETRAKAIPFPSPVFSIAATILILMVISLTVYFYGISPTDSMNMTARTRTAREPGLNLPDGSIVDLNTHSRISFGFDKAGNRNVTLDGEAYFNVSHNPDKPFTVVSGPAEIIVSGTTFSVRSISGGARIEVFVESGSVVLRQAGHNDLIRLEPGFIGILENDTLTMKYNIDENYLSWLTGKMAFRKDYLGEVVRVLNRTYENEFLLGNQELENCLFTGTFDQLPADSVVRVIQLALSLDVEQKRNSFVFSGEGCD